MILTDQIEQPCPAAELHHRCMRASNIDANPLHLQFLDHPHEHSGSRQIERVLGDRVQKDRAPSEVMTFWPEELAGKKTRKRH
jgi:hypothetical protein